MGMYVVYPSTPHILIDVNSREAGSQVPDPEPG